MLQVKGVSAAYKIAGRANNTTQVLDNVSFDLREGETLGIIGGNGVGKSTLLRLLAGIILPNMGEIIRKENVRASLLNLQGGFIPALEAKDNIVLGAILLGLNRLDAERKIDKVLEYADLPTSVLSKPVSTFSTGMRARLGFGIAMVALPDILLIDEVLGVGDAVFKVRSKSILEALLKRGQSAVLVSHDLRTVSELCERSVWLDKGCVAAFGATENVIAAYSESNMMACKHH